MPAAKKFTSILLWSMLCSSCNVRPTNALMDEIQLTSGTYGHTLNAAQVFSPDGEWIVYDTRNDDTHISRTEGIEKVSVNSGEIVRLYTTKNQSEYGPGVGAAAWNPKGTKIVFIHGLLDSDVAKPYGFTRRFGALVDDLAPSVFTHAEARTVHHPLVAGALRGGTHAHTWSGDGRWISFTYNDFLLEKLNKSDSTIRDLRTIGVMSPLQSVTVSEEDSDNFSGNYFAVVTATVTENPAPGTDAIDRAFDECWIGADGYVNRDGVRQHRAIAFQGNVRSDDGSTVAEVFVSDIPGNISTPEDSLPLEGTPTTRPNVPKGLVQRRVTFTANRKYPGLQGPRVRLRTSPDGSIIYFHMKDDNGVVQIYTVPTIGGPIQQLTKFSTSLQSQFNVSPDGKRLSAIADNRVWLVDADDGAVTPITIRYNDEDAPVNGASWSPSGKFLVYNRYVASGDQRFLQIFKLGMD